jgi:nucleoside-diphosphate-sugar epimerase
MRVFVTGASGWIGSATVDALRAAGHDVVGLARSERSAAALAAKGVEVQRGDLDDPGSLRAGAEHADAVVHLANKHDFAHPAVSNRAERDAVTTIGDVLAGSGRPLVIAAGVALGQDGVLTERDRSDFHGVDSPRGGSENLALGYADRGVRSVSVRFAPTVHGAGDAGFIATLVGIAREHGVSGYVGDGANRWAAVHRSDAAELVRLALDQKAPAGSVLHAIAEEGVPTREIAEAIGRGLGVPVRSVAPGDAARHFGWIGAFFGMDVRASNALTRRQLGWSPTGPTLAEDLASGSYFRA